MNERQLYHCKMKHLFKKAGKFGFNSPTYINNKALQAMYYIKKKEFGENSMPLVIIKLDYKDYLHKLNSFKNAISENMLCYYFEDGICYESHLKEFLQNNNTLFIIFECINYLYWDPMYVTHSTCAIINNGKCYFINSHGKDSKDICHYEYKTKSCEKTFTFKQGKDYTIISTLMNRYGIKMENTSKYMYYGANLQEYDNHGCCFIFPYYIWYYFEKDLKTNLKLLEKGKVSLVIYKIFFKNNPLRKNTNAYIKQKAEKNIKKLKWRLLSNVMNEYMGYMTQKKILYELPNR